MVIHRIRISSWIESLGIVVALVIVIPFAATLMALDCDEVHIRIPDQFASVCNILLNTFRNRMVFTQKEYNWRILDGENRGDTADKVHGLLNSVYA